MLNLYVSKVLIFKKIYSSSDASIILGLILSVCLNNTAFSQLVPKAPPIEVESKSVVAFDSRDYVEPRFDSDGLNLWIEAVSAPPELKDVVRSLYSIYEKDLKSLLDETEKKAEEIGRSKILPRQEGFPPIDYEEARLIRKKLFDTFLEASNKADQLLIELVDQIDLACGLDQKNATHGKAVVLRYVYLTKRRQYLSAWSQAPWVDAAFIWSVTCLNYREISQQDFLKGKEITDDYLNKLLPWLENNASKDREYRFALRMSRANLNSESCKEATRKGMQLWSELDDFNTEYIKQLENFLPGNKFGSEKGYWKNEYAGNVFPMLAAEDKTLRLSSFIKKEYSSETQKVDEILSSYGQKLRLLVEPIASEIRKVRKNKELDPWAFNCLPPTLNDREQSLHDEMLKISGTLAGTHLETYKQLFDLLDKEGVKSWEKNLFGR